MPTAGAGVSQKAKCRAGSVLDGHGRRPGKQQV